MTSALRGHVTVRTDEVNFKIVELYIENVLKLDIFTFASLLKLNFISNHQL